MGIIDNSGCSSSEPVEFVKVKPTPRWLMRHFGYWQPWQLDDGEWVIKREFKGFEPLFFLDEQDREAGHRMSEDEALDRARALNAMDFDGYNSAHEYWFAVPWEQYRPEPQPETTMIPIEEAITLFAGKTIQSVDASVVNKVVFYFMDGTIYDLWIEPSHGGFAELLVEVVATPAALN